MMNDIELSMVKSPGKLFLKQQLATSGIEMQWVDIALGIAAGVAGQVIGGNKASNAAKQQAASANAATDRQYEYDVKAWNMDNEKLIAERDQQAQVQLVKAANERRAADWKDASALRAYNYDLMIRNTKQQSLDEQYLKSTQLYHQQMDLNARTAYAGREDELNSLREIQAESAFNEQERYIQSLLSIGSAEAAGRTGVSARKTVGSIIAASGRKQAAAAEAMLGAERNTRSVLSEIARDQEAADMAAWAQKMLDPGELPLPLEPLATPIADFLLPRAIEEFDFGPQPVKGAMRDPSAAAGQVWGNTITGIAGTIGQVAMTSWQNR